MNILFFGSTTDSVLVLDAIYGKTAGTHTLNIIAVVTQPPRPVGRKGIITPTPVQMWAEEHHISVLSFPSNSEKSWEYENEQSVIAALQPFQADLLLSASYGQKIPSKTIADAPFGGLNIHPSILPRWRGADPVPWAMIAGDHQTGVTLVTLSESFDKGKLVQQKKVPILDSDLADPLRTKLFGIGATLFLDTISEFKGGSFEETVKNQEVSSYARKFHKQDGYIPWELLQETMQQEPGAMNLEAWKQIQAQYPDVPLFKSYITYQHGDDPNSPLGVIFERFFRALSPWPGLWTTIQVKSNSSAEMQQKRVKIIGCHVTSSSLLSIDTVQLEGKTPTTFLQFKEAYL